MKGAKFGPIFHTQFVDKWHVRFVGLCVDGSANYSSQVLHVGDLPISGLLLARDTGLHLVSRQSRQSAQRHRVV